MEFDHTHESYFSAVGLDPERYAELQHTFMDNIIKLGEISTKSVMVEALEKLLKPQTQAEYFFMGMMLGSYEANAYHVQSMTQKMKEKFQSRQDNVDDF